MSIMRNSISPNGYRNVPEHHAVIIGTILITNGVGSALVGILDVTTDFNDIRPYNYIAVGAPIWSGVIVSNYHTATS